MFLQLRSRLYFPPTIYSKVPTLYQIWCLIAFIHGPAT
jgi:hypothetical protein